MKSKTWKKHANPCAFQPFATRWPSTPVSKRRHRTTKKESKMQYVNSPNIFQSPPLERPQEQKMDKNQSMFRENHAFTGLRLKQIRRSQKHP
jgi:hypothetical protein